MNAFSRPDVTINSAVMGLSRQPVMAGDRYACPAGGQVPSSTQIRRRKRAATRLRFISMSGIVDWRSVNDKSSKKKRGTQHGFHRNKRRRIALRAERQRLSL